jgi:hypothetical protein
VSSSDLLLLLTERLMCGSKSSRPLTKYGWLKVYLLYVLCVCVCVCIKENEAEEKERGEKDQNIKERYVLLLDFRRLCLSKSIHMKLSSK